MPQCDGLFRYARRRLSGLTYFFDQSISDRRCESIRADVLLAGIASFTSVGSAGCDLSLDTPPWYERAAPDDDVPPVFLDVRLFNLCVCKAKAALDAARRVLAKKRSDLQRCRHGRVSRRLQCKEAKAAAQQLRISRYGLCHRNFCLAASGEEPRAIGGCRCQAPRTGHSR